MGEFAEASALLFILLNPFLVIVYLVDLLAELDQRRFRAVLTRAGLISSAVFVFFALLGDAVFERLIQTEFASFQIFGGIVFLLIGLRFVFHGNVAIQGLRGTSQQVAGAIAMPILIGPGTISAAVVIGKRLSPCLAGLAVISAVTVCIGVMLGLKALHDFVKPRNGALVHRYVEIAGRVTALVVGAISIEMIMRGIGFWVERFR